MLKRVVFLACLAAMLGAGVYSLFFHSRSKPGAASNPPAASVPPPTPGTRVAAAPSATVASNAAHHGTNSARLREADPVVNPYAAALREPGKSKRAWDADFLKHFQQAAKGDVIRFELTGGRMAAGTILITQVQDGALTYLSGELTEPEPGKFFFLTPPPGGKAGKAVGVVEFPATQTAYRIEPTGPNGDPELWQRRMDEVLCQSMPLSKEAASTDENAEMPPLRPDLAQEYVPSYNSNIVSLQSYPGSKAVLLLDFFGGSTPTWGGVSYPRPNVSNAQIRDVWKRVAEDYQPFNINVTTDLKVYQAAPASSRQRCVFTPSTSAVGSGAAGVAYIGSWNWGSDTVCWSVYISGKSGAEVGAHEPGHTLGLGHQGTPTEGYYGGHGNAPTGWAPIMGVGYYQPVATWAKGEYQNANNKEDELAMIVGNNNAVDYRSDDTGSTLATSRYLDLYPDFSVWAEGVIEQTGDTDAFQFTTSGGRVSLSARPVGDWANLAVMATLADAAGTILVSNNPQSVISATITTNLTAGTYTFRVTGAGRNDPLTNGFTPYASLGYYSVAGSVAGARLPTRLSVLEHVPNGTVVGTVPANSTGNALAYTIVGGNTFGTFAIDANGVLTVANSAQLDYARLATNTVLAVQYELFVNITNLDDPTLTELNRRVVVTVQKAGASYPIAFSGFNARVIVPYGATTANPQATGFDIANKYCFYQAGLSGNAQVSGSGGMQGFPPNGTFASQVDETLFQFGPYGGYNALLLGYTYPSSGTLTFANPQAYNSLSILASSANGGGLGTLTIRFTNGINSQPFSFNAQDWFNTTTNVAIQGFGRLNLNGGLQTEDSGGVNPNLYQTTINLAALGYNQGIASITFTKPNVGGNQNSGIFAVSGMLMPAAAAIGQQPQALTNNVGGSSSTFRVGAMGTPPLSIQWFSGSLGSGTLLESQTNATLVVTPGPVNQLTNYFVVVTNSFGAVTSSLATLTVFRAPVIAQQPAPTNVVLFAGASNAFSVAVNAALPVSYYWTRDETPLPGVTSASFTLNNLQPTQSGNYSVVVSNAFGSVTSSIVSLTVLASPSYPFAQRVLADRPIGYWRLDEKSGTIAHDYIAGKNGVYTNVVLNQPGYNVLDTHTAARFGALPANCYVGQIPIDFATYGNATFSVEAWVNGGTQSSDAGILTKGTGAGGEQFNLDCGGPGRAFRFFVRDAGGGAHLATSAVVPNNKWYHLVGVCDQVRSNITLYINGTNAAQGAITPGTGLLGSANAVTIGARQSGANSAYDLQFVGSIQEVAIYNFALNSNQVQTHFSVVTNRLPVFLANPFTLASANAGQAYSATIATNAADPNGDAIIFSKISGPAWLSVASNGTVSGTPFSGDAGENSFLVSARDFSGLSTSATMNLTVLAAPAISATLSRQGFDLLLNWSGGLAPYQVQMTTNLANPVWEDVGAPLNATTLSVSPTNGATFYRIRGQ